MYHWDARFAEQPLENKLNVDLMLTKGAGSSPTDPNPLICLRLVQHWQWDYNICPNTLVGFSPVLNRPAPRQLTHEER